MLKSPLSRLRNRVIGGLRRRLVCPGPPGTPITGRRLRKLIRRQDPLIIEIGAHVGSHSRWLLRCFPRARLICFEPDPRPLDRLREHLGSDPRVTIEQMAVGREPGRVVFHQSSGRHESHPADYSHIDSGSIRKPRKHLEKYPWVRFASTIEVECTTLDEYAMKHGIEAVDFIWMDVQGAEEDVFRGGHRMMSHVRLVWTEHSDEELYEGQRSLGELLELLPGFRLLERFQYDALLAGPALK